MTAILPRLVLFLTPSELDAVAERLTDRAIEEAMAENRMLLQTPQSPALEELVRLDPLHLCAVALQRVRACRASATPRRWESD